MEQKRTNKTDSPLKRLVELAPVDFAEWLLDTKVVNIRSANIELQPNPNATYSDLVFWVTVELSEEERKKNVDNRLLLHIEFQGASSERPMRFRVLDYLVGFADKERGTRIHSVVFYVGEKTNITDTGHHRVMGIGQRVTLAWHYDTIWLWNLKPQELLDAGRPALLPLLGQAKLERPDEIIPVIYQEIRSLPNEEMQHRLLIELLALLQDEEIIKMIETMMTQDEWVLDTPYLRRWRKQVEDAHNEGLQAGLQAGLEKGLDQGRAERDLLQQERKILIEEQRQNSLRLMVLRYKISGEEYLQMQTLLSSISSIEKLKAIADAVITVEDFGQFYLYVEETISSEKQTMAATI
ncbi:MAG: hypothetical protein AAF639_11870 [Chloroflexota bacterium]